MAGRLQEPCGNCRGGLLWLWSTSAETQGEIACIRNERSTLLRLQHYALHAAQSAAPEQANWMGRWRGCWRT